MLFRSGSAVEIDCEDEAKEIGTQNYAAPEILLGNKAGLGADLWSLGCILYEMFTGKPPFRAENIFLLIEKIQKEKLNFPNEFPETAKDLCLSLLKVNVEERLGFKGIWEIKNHPFFGGINFETIYTKPFNESRSEEYQIISKINIFPNYIPIPHCPSSTHIITQAILFLKRDNSYQEGTMMLMEDGKIIFYDNKNNIKVY